MSGEPMKHSPVNLRVRIIPSMAGMLPQSWARVNSLLRKASLAVLPLNGGLGPPPKEPNSPPPDFVPLGARPSPHGQPTTLYNAMIHPLVPFAIRGAIWYQGESNHVEGKLYTEKMKALIQGWRQLWGSELPFYYVQIAPYVYGSENPAVLAEFWEAQSAALEIPNTGMVVPSDIGNYKDIHPKNKQEVGRRLALLALKNVYGQSDLVCSGPTFKDMVLEGDKIRVRFDNIGVGLASRDGKPLNWFEVIGEARQRLEDQRLSRARGTEHENDRAIFRLRRQRQYGTTKQRHRAATAEFPRRHLEPHEPILYQTRPAR